jgi:hypothetical protein
VRTEFQRALAAADDQRDAPGRIAVIKKAVAAEVRAADPAVNVRNTDYFNHSFAPDMVLRWPKEDRERLLFVRPSATPSWLLDDLQLVASYRPMLFTLEDLNTPPDTSDVADEASRANLGAAATTSNTWITDPSGLAAISTVRTQDPVLGLLSQALVRGRRGVSDGNEVGALTASTSAGFTGATVLSTAATRAAIQAIESHLDSEQSGRLTRVLRAVWEGNGGASAQFPTTVAIGALTDDDLTYLLAATGDAPAEFWRRIGRTVTTAQLGRVRTDDPSPTLHALVSANLDTLQAKGLRVVGEPFKLGESEDVPRWIVSRGCLALRGLNWTAYLAARRIEELPPAEEMRAPDLATLRRRTGGRRVAITQVQIGRGDREVTYAAKDGIDVLDDPELPKVASDMNVTAIEGAAATLASGGTVNIDFVRRTAVGPTSSMFPVGSLVRSTLPLLSDLSEEEEGTVMAALQGTGAPDSLFPDLVVDN